MASKSSEQFLRSLRERHSAIKKAMEDMVVVSATDDQEKKSDQVRVFLGVCRHLDAILAEGDKPMWLLPAIQNALNHVQGNRQRGTLIAFLRWLFENRAEIVQPIEPREEGDVNFDQVYKRVIDAAGVPKLFDDLVDALGDIIALNVIDSSTVKEALEKLRVILKSNRGSRAAVVGAMNWSDFVSLLLKGYAKKFGGPAFEAFDKTYAEAKRRVEEANTNYDGEILERLLDSAAIKRFVDSNVVESTELIEFIPTGLLEQSEAEKQ